MASPDPSIFTGDTKGLAPAWDHGPGLLALSWVLLALSMVALGLRGYCKISTLRGFWWDDWVLIASWVSVLCWFTSYRRRD